MNLDRLRTFRVLASTLHFRRAARGSSSRYACARPCTGKPIVL